MGTNFPAFDFPNFVIITSAKKSDCTLESQLCTRTSKLKGTSMENTSWAKAAARSIVAGLRSSIDYTPLSAPHNNNVGHSSNE